MLKPLQEDWVNSDIITGSSLQINGFEDYFQWLWVQYKHNQAVYTTKNRDKVANLIQTTKNSYNYINWTTTKRT